jgi:hypothetical protein
MGAGLPTGIPGRMLALALVALALALVWFSVLVPLLVWHAARGEDLARKQALLHRMEALADSLPDWQRAQSEVAARGPARPALLAGNTDALAAAALQGMIQDMASRAGTTINSMEILPAEPRGGYRRIGVRVIAEGQYGVLLALWQAIGGASPRMLIDAVNLRGPDARTRTDAPPLAASFIVLGFRAGSPEPAAAGRP